MENIKSTFGLKVAILSISFLLMLRMTISPALAEIGKAFPALSQETLMFMVVMPSLVAIIVGFLAGIIAHKFKTKSILYTALVLFLIGGLGPFVLHDFKLIMVCRVILGAGTGLFLPFTAGLIATFFDGHERNHMIGLQSAAVGVGNIVTSLLAGLLAAIAWNMSFLIYAFAAITLLLVIIYIPEPPKHVDVEGKGKAVSVNKGVILVCVGILLYSIVYFAFFGYLAFVIDANGLGDSKAAGLATMLMTVGALCMGLLFSKFIRRMKNYTLFLSLLLNAVGFGILAFAHSLGAVFVGSIFVGLGFGLLMPYGTMRVNEAADRSSVNFANALFMTFINVGTAAAPKILVTIGQFFNNPNGQFIFQICSICLFIAAVVFLLVTIFCALRGQSPKAVVETR